MKKNKLKTHTLWNLSDNFKELSNHQNQHVTCGAKQTTRRNI